jgi:putative oxidoreductase
MMATIETLLSALRTSRGQPILKLQSAEQRASLALDLLSLGSRAALGVSFLLSVSDRLRFYGNPGERGVSCLLFLFGSAMAISFGTKSPFDYSVFAAMCCALFLGLAGSNRWTVDSLL